jgi:hypothetical protein
MGTLAAVVAEEEVDTGTTIPAKSKTVNPITVDSMLRGGCRTLQVLGASCSTQIAHPSLNRYRRDDKQNILHLGGAQHPAMSNNKHSRRHQSEHQKDQTGVVGEGLALHNEVARAVDCFYRRDSTIHHQSFQRAAPPSHLWWCPFQRR